MEKSKDRRLVIGADGLIGRALSAHLKSAGAAVIETTRKPDSVSDKRLFLDIAKDISDWQLPEHISVAYLCAAATSLVNCKKDPFHTKKINVTNTVALARKLVEQGAFVVFPSTNLVFDGSVAFQKADYPACPNTEYGRQKAEAEIQLLNLGESVATVRFTKILGLDTPLFKGWIEALRNNEIIHPFSDMVMSPVPLSSAVEVLYRIAEKRLSGIVQVSGKEDVSYEQAAYFIARGIGARKELFQPVKSTESGIDMEAAPLNTTLDTSRMESALGMMPPDIWKTIYNSIGI